MRNLLIMLLALVSVAQGAGLDRYVSTNGTHDVTGGFTNWVGAATNIQAAVDKAAAGDTVWVTNGVYQLSAQISITKGIGLRGWSGKPDDTLLVGGYPALTNRIIYLNFTNAFVEGFTLTNGAAQIDGAISASVGGGARIEAGTLRGCTVIGCRSIQDASWRQGWGGGVYAKGVNSLVTDCRIESNTAYFRGGGVFLETGAQLRNSHVVLNTTLKVPDIAHGGGGVMIYGLGVAENCVIVSNKAPLTRGGGVSLVDGEARLVNSLVFANTANEGGGVSCHNSSITKGFNELVNCTVVSNSSQGIYVSYNSGKALWCENSIIYNNTPGSFSINSYNDGPEIYVQYTCALGVLNLSGKRITLGAGNFDANPMFVDLAGGNVRLKPASPCRDAGTNQLWMVGAKDLDGKPRLDRMIGKVDMGCYEFVSTRTLLTIR